MVEITVETPFPEYAVPRVWTWMERFRSRVADDFAPKTLEEFVDDWERRGSETWAVYRDGELGGLVTVEQVSPVVASSHCLFKKEFWGAETTIPALQQVYGKVFERGITKISSAVFHDNDTIKSLAYKIGAKREGMLRNQTLRGGKPVHMVVVGLLKEDFEKCLS